MFMSDFPVSPQHFDEGHNMFIAVACLNSFFKKAIYKIWEVSIYTGVLALSLYVFESSSPNLECRSTIFKVPRMNGAGVVMGR